MRGGSTRRLSRESDASDDARDAFAAFLAPSAAVAVRRGFLKLEAATFGLRELRQKIRGGWWSVCVCRSSG